MLHRMSLLAATLTAAAFSLSLATPAAAAQSGICRILPRLCEPPRPGPPRPQTPEIDPGVLRGVLTVLIGSALVRAERRRGR